MRKTIVIDDELMSQAIKVTGLKTKNDDVELRLKLLINPNRQQSIRKLRGKLTWEGDLDKLRVRAKY